ncbi:GMC oxidoreductase [Hymenobacter arizonensis]|uniref:GMC oxidoreductase n=1 Tax=Hymenobacter arizonensis TaxID=1227077 RepID=UPI0034E2388A
MTPRCYEKAVVNADGRAYDVPNLYISDNSTFPSALGANSVLTNRALSPRTADQFLVGERQRNAPERSYA